VVVVNTCAVTGEAARQCRQRVRRALRAGAAVVVTGCAAHPSVHPGAHPGASFAPPDAASRLVLEPDKGLVPARVAELGVEQLPGVPRPACPAVRQADDSRMNAPCTPRAGSPDPARMNAAGASDASPGTTRPATHVAGSNSPPSRDRAILKVQDGCPARCAYCIVPLVRPTLRSLPPPDAAAALARLVVDGRREVVLCGIHLGLYGVDLPGRPTLADLVERLLDAAGGARLRLSSLEPMELDSRLLALLAAHPDRLCPHLHLPLQSGDDGVLAAMGRPYRAAEFLETVARVRAALPRAAVTTDVLVGFPGETEAAFEGTVRVCRDAAFARLHVFPFSPRPGTRAEAMTPAVARKVIRDRCARLAAEGDALAAAYRRGLVGTDADVVIETPLPDGGAEGVSERYVRVRIATPLPAGGLLRARLGVRLTAAPEGVDWMAGEVRGPSPLP
jgi:tRNA A37 methylthiotransferase MiaB